MEAKTIFGDDVENYDRMRPRYCPELFSAIWEYSGINAEEKALEIGPGTGQATESFLQRGYSVTAVERDKRLSEYCREKFRGFPSFQTVNCSFEAYRADEGSFSLLYSATAFHWIPEKTGYLKAHFLLKAGGTLALFWNIPFVGREDDPLHREIQKVYEKYRPGTLPKEIRSDRYCSLARLEEYGFSCGCHRRFFQIRCFGSEDYIALLNTYSDHRALPDETRMRLEEGIQSAIEKARSPLRVYDTIELYLAKKP